MIETDDFEKKLEKFCERNQVEIRDEFLQKLLTLDSEKKTAPKRRRYVLPIAALVALALGLSGWAWLHFTRTEDAQATDQSFTLEEPASREAETPAVPSGSAKPEEQEMAAPSESAAPNQPDPAESVSLTKQEQKSADQPKSEGSTPVRSDAAAPESADGTPQIEPDGDSSAQPEDAALVKPDDPTTVKPEATTPAKPNAPSPAKPVGTDPVTPDASTPAEPDDPTPQEPDETNQPGTEAPDPPEPSENDTPQIPPYVSPYGAVYLNEGDREILTVTLLATGESMEIDVTGWEKQARINSVPASAENHEQQPGETTVDPEFGGVCIAFGTLIMYNLKLGEDGTVYAMAVDPMDYAKYYANYHVE